MNARGFTLVELATVLVIAGIVASFVIPRSAGRSAFESRGFYGQAQSLVRYAQKVAIAQRRSAPNNPIYVVITTSPSPNQLRICYDASCTTPVIDPTTNAALALSPPTYVGIAPALTFSFDGSGAPSLASQQTINVTSSAPGDVATRAFYVEALTGYVHQ